MARRRDFVRGAAAIAHKRLTSWFQFLPVTTAMSAVGGTVIFSLNAAALALRPFTIVRTRFELMIISDQGAMVESQVGAFGMAVVSDQAVAVGVTAVPTPIIDMASDLWFVHQTYMAQNSSLVDVSKDARYITIDSKAMRKVDIGQDIVVVAEFSGAGSGQVLTSGGRMLIKVN